MNNPTPTSNDRYLGIQRSPTITNKLTLALLAWIPDSSGLETRGRGSRQRANIEGLAPVAT